MYSIYKPVATPGLLFEDEEKLIQIQETEMLEYFGRKSKSPEPLSKARKLSVDEVSPPVPKRRKKKSKTDLNNSETDIYKSFSYLDVSTETWQQPIEQKDHWGLPPGLKTINNGRIIQGDTTNSQIQPMNYKTKSMRITYVINIILHSSKLYVNTFFFRKFNRFFITIEFRARISSTHFIIISGIGRRI